MTEQDLLAQVEADRREGRTIAFANGCFDLLHVGHVRYLQGARAEADRLVVAINSDLSTRGLKGEGRPILDERARAELVGALRCVDYVVIFDDPTVDPLLELIRPDANSTGPEYEMNNLPERETVRRLGITYRQVGDPKDHSTTDLIRRVAEAQRAGGRA